MYIFIAVVVASVGFSTVQHTCKLSRYWYKTFANDPKVFKLNMTNYKWVSQQ